MKSERSRMTLEAGLGALHWKVLLAAAMALSAVLPDGGNALADSLVTETVKKVVQAATSSEDARTAPDEAREEPAPPDEVNAVVEPEPVEEPDITVSPDGRVEMHVRDLALSQVLQMLSMQSRRNIVASKQVSGNVTANLYNVTFDEALGAILASNGCGYREQGSFIYVYTAEELKQMDTASQVKISRLFRLHHTRAADIKAMIQPLLSEGGSIAVTPPTEAGIPADSEGAGGDALAIEDCLLVIDFADRIESVAKVIAELDVRPTQIMIEATILRAQLGEDNALGIDFNILGGVDFESLSSVSPGVMDLTTGQLPRDRMQQTTFTTRTDFVDSPTPPRGFRFGIIKNSVGVFINALEEITDTTVLANPKVLVLNKQRGEVIVGRRDGYLTTTVTETAAVQTVEFLETGTRLIFRPFIGEDGYVRMEVHPEDSSGGLNASNLPEEQTTEVTTNIIVRDGHTILIGGLFREVTESTRAQVPGLGNIPVAGALFRQKNDSTAREEVVILLTVHIVKDDDTMSKLTAEAVSDVERFRVGMRQGLMWFGRERLAQAHYKWSLEHLAKGHLSCALWDLDLAINNDPKFLAAIRLKERLLDKREWDEENSAIRSFLTKVIMEERGVIMPVFERPGPPFEFPSMQGPSGFEDAPDETGINAPQTVEPTS